MAHFEEHLQGVFADETIKRHVSSEVEFVVNAYREGSFQQLDLLKKTPDGRLYIQRYARFAPAVVCAMLYDTIAQEDGSVAQVAELATAPGSTAVLFGMGPASFRMRIEALHDRGRLRYETAHNLDQIRLKPGFSSPAFLTAYYEDRELEAVQ